MARYKVNSRTNILKENPNKKDMFGDIGTDVVGTLEAGDVIEVVKTGGGGRGVVMTPYLYLADDTYIIGNFADKVDDSTPLTSKSTMQPPTKISQSDNDFLNKQYQDAINQQNALSQQNNLTSKYVFNQDFEATTKIAYNKDTLAVKYKFKKGDIFDGKKIPVNAGVNPEAKKYNIQITTPESIKLDGSVYTGQVTYEIDDSLVKEATAFQQNKKYLLILGALVLGYLAYKKFNK